MLHRIHTYVATSALALAFVQCAGDTQNQTANAPPPPPAEEPAAQPTVRGPGAPSNSPVVDNAAASPQASGSEAGDKAALTAGEPAGTQVTLTDEQIAAITDGANSAEINQATVARTKSKNQAVLKFAAMMIAHHGDAQKKQAKLKLKLEESKLSQTMVEESNDTLSSLKAKTGADFDKAYAASQVEGHQKVLNTINAHLLTSVKSPELKAYLEEIKPTVEKHLEEAKTLQASLDKGKTSVSSGK